MNIIASVDKNWGIGKNGNLLDRFKEDMLFFKNKTLGNIVIMGRTTFNSLPGAKPLPNRENIVLSKNPGFNPENTAVFNDINNAVQYALSKYPSENIYFIGGAEVYRQALDICDTAYITKFSADYSPDCFIPNLDNLKMWIPSEIKALDVDKNGTLHRLVFTTYKKAQ